MFFPPPTPRAVPRTEEGVGASGSTQNITISPSLHTNTSPIARRKGFFLSCFCPLKTSPLLLPKPSQPTPYPPLPHRPHLINHLIHHVQNPPNQHAIHHPHLINHLIHYVNLLTPGLYPNAIAPPPNPLHSHALSGNRSQTPVTTPATLNMGKKDRKKKQQAAKAATRQSSGGSGGSGQQHPRLP